MPNSEGPKTVEFERKSENRFLSNFAKYGVALLIKKANFNPGKTLSVKNQEFPN